MEVWLYAYSLMSVSMACRSVLSLRLSQCDVSSSAQSIVGENTQRSVLPCWPQNTPDAVKTPIFDIYI